jgi:hypothetical protein
MWKKFKDTLRGGTEEEVALRELDRELWHLKRIIAWNAEFGKRHFDEGELRAQISNLNREIASRRRQLPRTSQYKEGPWLQDSVMHPILELVGHIRYLRQLLYYNAGNSRFPTMEVEMRLRILEQQLKSLGQPPNMVVIQNWQPRRGPWLPPAAQGWGYQTSPGWNPPSGGAVPISGNGTPGWGPPSPSSSGSSGDGWGPASGAAVPISDGSGWGPVSSVDEWSPPVVWN